MLGPIFEQIYSLFFGKKMLIINFMAKNAISKNYVASNWKMYDFVFNVQMQIIPVLRIRCTGEQLIKNYSLMPNWVFNLHLKLAQYFLSMHWVSLESVVEPVGLAYIWKQIFLTFVIGVFLIYFHKTYYMKKVFLIFCNIWHL